MDGWMDGWVDELPVSRNRRLRVREDSVNSETNS